MCVSQIKHITGPKTGWNRSRQVFFGFLIFRQRLQLGTEKIPNLCNRNRWSGLLQLGSVRFPSFFQSSELDLRTLFMDAQGINLTIFLDALSWGDPDCNLDKIRYAQTGLILSEELPLILQGWWKPPRVPGSPHARTQGATEALNNFTSSCFSVIAEKELENLTPLFFSHTACDVMQDELTSIKIPDAVGTVQRLAPCLWSLLHGMAVTRQQQENNTRKNPNTVSFVLNNKNSSQLYF